MKPLLTLLTTLLAVQLSAQTFSDQFFKDFAAPSGDELTLKFCSFDPDASAVFLRKDATVIPDREKMFTYYRTRIKILRSNGLEHGNVKIRFYHANEYEKIANLTAVTINYDDQGVKKMHTVSNKDIHYTKDDQYYTSIVFSMPELREGSIIEYSYISERRSYRIVDYWYFQDEIPVLHSTFDYTIMPEAQFSYRVLKSRELPISMREVKTEGRLIFSMDNLPGITDEAFMDAKRDYLSRVELQMNYSGSSIDRQKFVANWQDLTMELLKDEDFGQAIRKRIGGTEDIIKQASLIPSMKDRMNFIYRIVQQQLNWNHYIGIYAAEKLKTVWDKKSGSAAEINLVLLNLLDAAGVPASPLLVSDRFHGKVNTSHPFISQFSKVIAFAEIDGREYYLDASGNHVYTELIPENILNTQGYLVDRKLSRFVLIADPLHFEKRSVNIVGKVQANGTLLGQAFVTDKDYARIQRVGQVKRDQEGYIQNTYVKPHPQMLMDSFHIRNQDKDTLPLEQLLHFRQQLELAGDYYLLSTNLFGGVEKNPFLAEKRYTEINFGCKRSISFNESFDLEDGLELEGLPKPLALRTQDTGLFVSRMTDKSADGKKLVVKTKLEINRTLYGPDEYDGLREFFKKMYGVLNEPIVLKKKP